MQENQTENSLKNILAPQRPPLSPQEEVEFANEVAKNEISNKGQKRVFTFMIGIFLSSSLLTFVFPSAVGLWYIGAGFSIVAPIFYLLKGIVTLNKGGGQLVGFAVLLFVASLVVGYGTCLLNMSGAMRL
jgi:hypothetical protein